MEQSAKLVIDGKTFELPIVVGSEGERAIDISKLRQETGLITFDPGFVNTANCQSAITFV
ncbi:MAG: citrate (Si)-synthase, partial [Deltaproteobacteria bacterium]